MLWMQSEPGDKIPTLMGLIFCGGTQTRSKPTNTLDCVRWWYAWCKMGQGERAADGILEPWLCPRSCQELTMWPQVVTIIVNIGWELPGANLYAEHFRHWPLIQKAQENERVGLIIFEVSFSSDICVFIQQHLIVMLHPGQWDDVDADQF